MSARLCAYVWCVLGEGLPKRSTWVCEVGGTLFKQLLGRRLWVWKLVHVPGMGMDGNLQTTL